MTVKNRTIHPVRSRPPEYGRATVTSGRPASNGTRFISVLLILSMLAPAVLLSLKPQHAEAQAQGEVPVADFEAELLLDEIATNTPVITAKTTLSALLEGKSWAQKLLELALMAVARAVLARLTQATINWINSDFHGSPLFLENPGSFFADIAKSQIRTIVDLIGYDTLRFPFGPQTALNIIAGYKSTLASNAQYTLSRAIYDPNLLARYRNDFNVGGWNGFLINTQYPQNNYLGFQMMVQENLAARLEGTVQAPAQKIQSLLQQGMGFLSPQMCPSNPSYNNGTNEFLKPSFHSKTSPPAWIPPTAAEGTKEYNDQIAQNVQARNNYDELVSAQRATWATTNVCPGGLVNTTPGSVAANQIMMAMGSEFRQTELAAALGNSLSAIFDALISHFLEKGLNALSSTISPSTSGSDWSYNGQSLDGGSIPDGASVIKVSVTVGETSSEINIGGKGPYTMTNLQDYVAKATIIGTGLTIKGIELGTALVTITDSSDPVKTVKIEVTVNVVGGLAANPSSISIDILGDTASATISGGTGPYFMDPQTDSSKKIASVTFKDGNLIVVGIATGTTSVTIRDSSTSNEFCPLQTSPLPPPCIVIIPIEIGGGIAGDLRISKDISSVIVGKDIIIPITGGIGTYSLDSVKGTAKASVSGSTLVVHGVSVGSTTITVRDSAGHKAGITITTIPDPKFLRVDPLDVRIIVGHTAIAKISGGNINIGNLQPPYYRIKTYGGEIGIPGSKERVEVDLINGDTLSFFARANERTSTYLIIEDSTLPTHQTFKVFVYVTRGI